MNSISTVALSSYPDIEVTVYEGASKLAEVGAGVGVFPSTLSLPLVIRW